MELANATVNATGDIKMKHTQPAPYPGKWGTIWQIVIACALTFVAFITPVQVARSNCMDLSDLYRFVNLFGHADSKGGSTKGGDSKCICKHMKIHSLHILACIIILQFVINFWFNYQQDSRLVLQWQFGALKLQRCCRCAFRPQVGLLPLRFDFLLVLSL